MSVYVLHTAFQDAFGLENGLCCSSWISHDRYGHEIGEARQGSTRHGKTRKDKARQCKPRHGKTRQERQDNAKQTYTWQDKTMHAKASSCNAMQDFVSTLHGYAT